MNVFWMNKKLFLPIRAWTKCFVLYPYYFSPNLNRNVEEAIEKNIYQSTLYFRNAGCGKISSNIPFIRKYLFITGVPK